MKTFQDFEAARAKGDLPAFIMAAINAYTVTNDCQNALLGRDYMQQRNRTATQLERVIRDGAGIPYKDTASPKYRCASAFYKSNIIQITQHLLANGITFEKDDTKAALGGDVLDNKVVRTFRAAAAEGRAYGYFKGKGKGFAIFYADELVPLYDEETGAIRAAIRHWQFAEDKPLRVTLYEVGGYTEMRREKEKDLVCLEGFSFAEPRPYKEITATYENGETVIVGYENYPGLPIVPAYANYDRQAEIVGKREHIDAYDLIESGFANNVEEASFIYWKLTNASGMDDVDIAEFRRRIREQHVAKTDNVTDVQAETLNVPVEARETLLTRLENDIYADAMTVNLDRIAGGDVRATAIEAAYKRLNDRVDELEYCVIEFIQGLLALAGIEDMPTFKRSQLTNDAEITDMVLSAAEYLDEETILSKLPFLSADEVETVMERRAAESVSRFTTVEPEEEVTE